MVTFYYYLNMIKYPIYKFERFGPGCSEGS